MKRKVPEETKQKILQNSSVNPPYNPKAVQLGLRKLRNPRYQCLCKIGKQNSNELAQASARSEKGQTNLNFHQRVKREAKFKQIRKQGI